MSRQSRERMIEGAVILLAKRGLQAASFSEILEATGAPRGSIYHHFPGGKDQLVAEAVDFAGNRAIGFLDTLEGKPAEIVASQFLNIWRSLLNAYNFKVGCSVLAVSVAADSTDLLDRAASVFRRWCERLTELFIAGGLDIIPARRLATLLVASSEGVVAISRAQRSMDSFELVAEQLLVNIRNASKPSPEN